LTAAPIARMKRRVPSFRDRLDRWAPAESGVLVAALGIAASLWVFVIVASLVVSGHVQTIDERVLLAFRRPDDPAVPIGPRWCHQVAVELTALGSVPVMTAIILAVCAWMALADRRASIGILIASSCGAGLLNTALKSAFGRPRPTVVPQLAMVDSMSFPSGHAMIAAAVYLTLGALLARTTTSRKLRLYYLGVALAVSGLVAFSRVYLGVHYPSDVLAGMAAGALWALVCDLAAWRLQREGVERPPAN
jgi:undecaprenyl-diphosphatase